MEKLKYAVWTPRVKEKQNCMYWHKYLHLHLYKVKKADTPVPPAQRVQLLSEHVSYVTANKRQRAGNSSLKSVVPKSSKLLCQSLPRGIRSISQKASVHSTCSRLWGHCNCTLYAPISSFTCKGKDRFQVKTRLNTCSNARIAWGKANNGRGWERKNCIYRLSLIKISFW